MFFFLNPLLECSGKYKKVYFAFSMYFSSIRFWLKCILEYGGETEAFVSDGLFLNTFHLRTGDDFMH